MSWRSIVITQPAKLSFKDKSLIIDQEAGQAKVSLEDIACLLLDSPQLTLTSALLSALAEAQVALISVDERHTPNGIFHAFHPHSRAVKVMRQQLAMTEPTKKRLWAQLITQKLRNQAAVLERFQQSSTAQQLMRMASKVRSGDPDNLEAQAAMLYFPALFYPRFTRQQSRFYNAALNYAYAVLRAAIARSLVGYGFLPAFGLHHASEQNAFNLADDLIEPFRPVVDAWIFQHYPEEPDRDLLPADKGGLVNLLHQDCPRLQGDEYLGKSTILSLIEACVVSLSQALYQPKQTLVLAGVIHHE
jgi:CRISPR-associated protein Cas1